MERSGVARGVGILRAEGRPAGVDIGKGVSESLAFKLAAHGEKSALAEEVFGRFRQLVLRQRGHAEEFTRAFAIACGDDRRVDINEIPLLGKGVDGIGEATAHPEDGSIEVSPWSEVGDAAQKFRAMAFFLKWVVVGDFAHEFQGSRLHFPSLTGGWRGDEFAPDFDGGTGEHFRDRYVARDACVGDDLQISEAGSVVEFEERKGFRVPAGPHPPGDVEVIGRLGALEHVFDQRSHGLG